MNWCKYLGIIALFGTVHFFLSGNALANSSFANNAFTDISLSEKTPTKPINRIITLSPNTTELAFSAGLGGKIIAVSEYSDYPPAAQKLETVANYKGINLEKIVSLKPDLVISAMQLNMRQLDMLKHLGINVYLSSVENVDDIADQIEHLSQWANDPLIGQQKAQQFRQQLSAIKTQYQDKKKIGYFYQINDKPWISVSEPHWPTTIFNLCGGENSIPSSDIPYPQLNIETIIQAKPEVIIASKLSDKLKPWQQIPAVKNQHILSINPDLLSRPTLRSLQAIEQVCRYFEQVRSL